MRSEHAWKAIAALSFALLHPAAHSEPVKVFGMPLGGLPAVPLKICPQGQKSPNICWVDKPFVSTDGSRLGTISMPSKNVPEWAAYNEFRLMLSRKGTIESIEVRIADRCDINTIASSIATRFGQPTQNSMQLQEVFKTANWELPEIFIHLEVAGPNCFASFQTPEARAAHLAYLQSQKINRPATP